MKARLKTKTILVLSKNASRCRFRTFSKTIENRKPEELAVIGYVRLQSEMKNKLCCFLGCDDSYTLRGGLREAGRS